MPEGIQVMSQGQDQGHREGDPVSIEGLREAIKWVEDNAGSVEEAKIKTGDRTINQCIEALKDLIALPRPGEKYLSSIKPKGSGEKSRKKFDQVYSKCLQANRLLQFWARETRKDRYPHVSVVKKHMEVRWATLPAPPVVEFGPPARVWVVLRRWWDEYVDSFFLGMSSMAELMGVGLCVRTVDDDRAIGEVIEEIARDHSSPRETVSILMVLGNENDEGMGEGIGRAERFLRDERQGRLFITTVGHNGSNIQVNNKELGEKLANRMLKDLAGAGKLDGRVILFGASHKEHDDAHKVRRKSFRETVTARRSEKGRPASGHRLEMPEYPDVPNIDRDLIFDPQVTWQMRDLLKEYLAGESGPDVVAVYTQTTLATLGAGLAIQAAGRDDIRLYAEYVSPSLLRWFKDDRWPLEAIAGVDPYMYGRLVFRAAATRTEAHPRRIVIPPILIGREAVFDDRLTYMVELPRVFPEEDIFLESLDRETRAALSRDPWYRKLFERIDQSRALGKIDSPSG